eukprot:CAMPEP_0206446338 /NCGR_PEP_ID=MMETSP0324_2-20121206/16072_1 /ASSEMBLY_ACC=CAM_ASM_000836 /TAXON_ID=2866 /ORGANISM="Crypthecodinium cohnii, Strain Seligo" /LENGTH=70 /DNA_ID=CAMNT_0053914781 /DNA_START=128 /DNA_END=340 /DNA_ORIENTATION=-
MVGGLVGDSLLLRKWGGYLDERQSKEKNWLEVDIRGGATRELQQDDQEGHVCTKLQRIARTGHWEQSLGA